MNKHVSQADEATQNASIDRAIGSALRDLRETLGLTARQLATDANISAAMISRIENGQVSPSIATMNALSQAMNIPLVSLFRDTASEHADYTHVRQGDGQVSTRMVDNHSHDFTNLAFHTRRDLHFEACTVTLLRQAASPPVYIGHGVLFIYVLEGEATYGYGDREISLKAGDSLSLDAELRHGFMKVLSEKFTFLNVQAERR